MLPVSELNRMRRELVKLLQDRTQSFPRSRTPVELPHFASSTPSDAVEWSVLVRTEEQAMAALESGAKRIYLDLPNLQKLPDVAQRMRNIAPSVSLWGAGLRIMKPHETGYFKYLQAMHPDGVLVRNLGALEYWRGKGVRLCGDFSLNVSNTYSLKLLVDQGLEACTVSYDLNAEQIIQLLDCGGTPYWELVLHQHMPLFHSEHCVFCAFLTHGHNFKDCGRPCERHDVRVIDRTGAAHYLRSDEGCRNTLFNAHAQSSARCAFPAIRRGLRRFRLEFLTEDANQVKRLMHLYKAYLSGRESLLTLLRQVGAVDRPGITEAAS